eukprot:TRINITY_DN10613_c0_g1_i1.p1 TRINITY_DN10613_c0_g1~~TRINITY_DN10613_c0_g1_i1.p1  ORF type:complete len:234 (-),score=6.94 TRINITY_DN10613_c0_g1_i1:53-754(-)
MLSRSVKHIFRQKNSWRFAARFSSTSVESVEHLSFGVTVSKPNLPAVARGRFVSLIDGLFIESEMKDWIRITEERGYEAALVNIGNKQQKLLPNIRNSTRCIIDDHIWADLIFNKVREFLPPTFQDMKLVGINERLRFLRYDPGEQFKPHFDGVYTRDDSSAERSAITILINLNEEFQGGETVFLGASNVLDHYVCQPKTGRVILMEHRILHEGRAPTSGRKYILRSDVMYAP